jgi:hypothetical protein
VKDFEHENIFDYEIKNKYCPYWEKDEELLRIRHD